MDDPRIWTVHVLPKIDDPGDLLHCSCVCKQWNQVCQQLYPQLHSSYFGFPFYDNLSHKRNYLDAKNFYCGSHPLYPGWNAYILQENMPSHLVGKDYLIFKAIHQKYEVEMFNRYWQEHYVQHYESGRNKCARNPPYIEFKIIRSDEKTGYVQLHILIRAQEYKRSCWTPGGKINVNI